MVNTPGALAWRACFGPSTGPWGYIVWYSVKRCYRYSLVCVPRPLCCSPYIAPPRISVFSPLPPPL